MAKQYSLGLRSRVIEYINKGHEQKEAAIIFNLSTSTVNRWWLRFKKEGTYSPKKRKGSIEKVNRKKLEEYVLCYIHRSFLIFLQMT